MAATKREISSWFDKGIETGHDYMAVICDTFEYDDYPVYIQKQNFEEIYGQYKDDQWNRVMEVYDLHQDKEKQLAEERAFHFPHDYKSAA